jgi:hypothetical protein
MATTRTTRRPITPALHGLLDYGLAAGNLVLPSVLGMSGRARGVFAAFGLVQGAVDAVTVQPYAVRPIVPLAVHKMVDLGSAPVFAAVPLLTGVAREPRARFYWLAVGAALVAMFVLTDWEADPST